MSEDLVDVRTPLASSKNARVELGRDGVLHVLTGPVTVHMDRVTCEELATTLARAMVRLSQVHPKTRPPALVLVSDGADGEPDEFEAVPRGGSRVR